MLKVVLAALLLLVLSGCYPVKQEGSIKGAQSSISGKEDPYTKDFGRIFAGEVVRYSFMIKNESKQVLNIKGVTTSCGCTVSEVKKKILKPGESASVDVKFDSRGYLGTVQQFVYVNTDRLDASASLSVNGEQSRTIDTSIIRFIIKADVIK